MRKASVDAAAVAAGVRVDLPSLIALRRAGEHLTLRPGRPRARQSGGLVSLFRGRGMEYEESRPYEPGDDLRSFDWRVTARTGKPYTKLFREERERPVLVCVDYRHGMHFATRGAFKSVIAARAAAAIAWSALDHGDRLGGLVFGAREHRELRPRRGGGSVMRLLGELVHHPAWEGAPEDASEDALALRSALMRLRRVARPGSLIFVLSDFHGLGAAAGGEEALARIAAHSDVVLVFIHDALERELPPPALYRIRDAHGAALLDTRIRGRADAHRARFQARCASLESLCARNRMRLVRIATDADWLAVLARGLGTTKIERLIA